MVALELVMKFLKSKMPKAGSNSFPYQVVDPFVGMGSVVYVSHLAGFSALGIDIDPKQISSAKELLSSI